MIVSFAKMQFHCRVLIEDYFPLPSSDDIATSPQNVKMYSVMCEIAFQSERCKKAVHSRILKSFRVKYSKNSKKPRSFQYLTMFHVLFLICQVIFRTGMITCVDIYVVVKIKIQSNLKFAQSKLKFQF